jgi:hypothetical protein
LLIFRFPTPRIRIVEKKLWFAVAKVDSKKAEKQAMLLPLERIIDKRTRVTAERQGNYGE